MDKNKKNTIFMQVILIIIVCMNLLERIAGRGLLFYNIDVFLITEVVTIICAILLVVDLFIYLYNRN